jgi:hypothetical protein
MCGIFNIVTALPSGPLFANVSTWNESAILITWPPVTSKNEPFTYSVDCFKCKDEEDKNCVEPCGVDIVYYPSQNYLKTTTVSVSGLPSGTKFKFKVYVVTEISTDAKRSVWKHTKVYGRTEKGNK